MLWKEVVFGPIHSRRLGVSLGINLISVESKLCNFNCVYCECGWNRNGDASKKYFNARNIVRDALKTKLEAMKSDGKTPDSITFSGNGEPTMHPDFEGVIDDTIALRNEYEPKSKISVLTNATMIGKESVRKALLRVDNAILKLDSGFDETVRAINQPQFDYSVAKVIEGMKQFNGRMVLQTMFLRGNYNGKHIDNTTDAELNAWIEAVKQINPCEIMIYTIDRQTPADDLQKVGFDELDKIAERPRALGFKVDVAKK